MLQLSVAYQLQQISKTNELLKLKSSVVKPNHPDEPFKQVQWETRHSTDWHLNTDLQFSGFLVMKVIKLLFNSSTQMISVNVHQLILLILFCM